MSKSSSATITGFRVTDVRFPTSQSLDGSDAMNKDPDYSAAYVILETDHPSLEGHGFTFTIGRGNEICCLAIQSLAPMLIGTNLDQVRENPGAFWKKMIGDSQFRWLGPEKGVIHLATCALTNAVWDLWAKAEEKPLWKLLVDLEPEQVVAAIDFRHIDDALTPEEALAILNEQKQHRALRETELRSKGFPAYTTSAGWLGYSEEKVERLSKQWLDRGLSHLKLKIGLDLDNDMRRAAIMREVLGDDRTLSMDANQIWGVNQAIDYMKSMSQFNPYWIEEPVSPDDILGHATIKQALNPIKVATGEHCHNRVMFKQFFQANAMDICQLDSARMGGVNEALAVILMAHKFKVPVCPHAGGVGLCELVQHLSFFDFVAVSGDMESKVIEYVDHLHEHFIDPVIIENGRYQVSDIPGYSATIKPESLHRYDYNGPYWNRSIFIG